MLYYTLGDHGEQPARQLVHPDRSPAPAPQAELDAKDYAAYVGKSLRIAPDGTIPVDNPELDGVKSHVFTYGHRNMQGIAFGPDGTLYASEQGPKTDDEINILKAGRPTTAGPMSRLPRQQRLSLCRWAESEKIPPAPTSNSPISKFPNGVPFDRETDWDGVDSMTPPLATMFTVPNDWNFADPNCGGVDFICWPTVAASSIEHYPATGGVPGWGNSLIITTLKRGSLYASGWRPTANPRFPPSNATSSPRTASATRPCRRTA